MSVVGALLQYYNIVRDSIYFIIFSTVIFSFNRIVNHRRVKKKSQRVVQQK